MSRREGFQEILETNMKLLDSIQEQIDKNPKEAKGKLIEVINYD